MTSSFERVYGALIGQAVGDALGAPTEGLTRAQIIERYGWVSDFVDDDPAGTDDTEYAVLTAQVLLAHGTGLTPAQVGAAWTDNLVNQVGGFYGGGFSEMTAINNLRAGLAPPVTGSDNHEMWSDGAAMRIAPVGILCAGDPAQAARLAAVEAQVSHAKDGVYCAQVIAAGVAAALTATSWQDVVEAALDAVPADSWTGRTVRRAIGIGSAHTELAAALDELYERISIFHYPFADVGPEATALAMGVFVAARGEYVPSVLGGTNIGRDADTIAAMAGSLAGALHGSDAVPEAWRRRINVVRGHCIAATAGTDLTELARDLHIALTAKENAA
ncbi:ADP-ribosylglycohydrolase family protein [Streptomyces sp. 35G-GA-8]|uniref:ADP-ribosylglycohydrolase family protein n=1 Tax=Streptomyces sp. 35G-GA-8 TaxID=2939434 RepID=UPI00201F7440|nr:ADP-ribosylglycohydrolase family protein [Streptomyces sp. 35G-GA-8]MCL7380402.1 ADP-ribosylglycohydrolase family protein [Streptomyces sp. 35G-GA-8]